MMRTEPASILSILIESVTIYPDEPEWPVSGGRSKDLTHDHLCHKRQRRPEGGVSSSAKMVAGTRTERCHTSPVIDI